MLMRYFCVSKATCSTKVGSVKLDLTVYSELEEVVGGLNVGTRMKETYSSSKIDTFEVPLSGSLFQNKIIREMIVTYLDDDLMVVRDQFGGPDVLKRKEMIFIRTNNEGEPSANDAFSDAPGAS